MEPIQYERLRQQATQRAFRRLAKAHAEEFDRLLAEEREAVGIPAERRPFSSGGASGTCSVPGCAIDAEALHLCDGHLSRLRRLGDVQADKPLRIYRRKTA